MPPRPPRPPRPRPPGPRPWRRPWRGRGYGPGYYLPVVQYQTEYEVVSPETCVVEEEATMLPRCFGGVWVKRHGRWCCVRTVVA